MLGAILIWGPLYITAVLACVVFAGLVWAPLAALIAWHIARRRGLDRRRHALAGAAYSVFLLLPWFLWVAAQLRPRMPGNGIQLSHVLLYFVWLLGPILFWGQWYANAGIPIIFVGAVGSYEDSALDNWLAVYSVFAIMILMWIGSVVNSIRTRKLQNNEMAIGYIIPFSLAWLCTLMSLGYLLIVPSE